MKVISRMTVEGGGVGGLKGHQQVHGLSGSRTHLRLAKLSVEGMFD